MQLSIDHRVWDFNDESLRACPSDSTRHSLCLSIHGRKKTHRKSPAQASTATTAINLMFSLSVEENPAAMARLQKIHAHIFIRDLLESSANRVTFGERFIELLRARNSQGHAGPTIEQNQRFCVRTKDSGSSGTRTNGSSLVLPRIRTFETADFSLHSLSLRVRTDVNQLCKRTSFKM
jgi:hypothetical protein